MMKSAGLRFWISVFTIACLSGCAQAKSSPAAPETSVPDQAAESTPMDAAPILQAVTPQPDLLPKEVFASDSPFCSSEMSGSEFSLECKPDALTIRQADRRRNVNAFLLREYPAQAGQFLLQADITSTTAADAESDRNAYGFYFVDASGVYHALRIQGQYFNFETWKMTAIPEVAASLTPAFSPFILSERQENHWELVCAEDSCNVSVNGNLIGHVQAGTAGKTLSIGLFTVIQQDEDFGSVTFSNLKAFNREDTPLEFQPVVIEDDLKSDHGTFSQSGMSGAFHTYNADGFHFSPVVSRDYYEVRVGPALQNMEVSATIKMEIDRDNTSGQAAGLICRSSQFGMYAAVIQSDSSYSIYRITPDKSPSLLAESTTDAVENGLTENDLRLVCQANTISLYINDQIVESLSDQRYDLNFGRAGLYTKAGSEPNADAIVFSNFIVNVIE